MTWILAAGAIAIAGWATLRLLRDQPVIFKQLIAAGVVVALLLVSMVFAAIQLATGHNVTDPVVFWGYYIAGALLFPFAGLLAVAERTKWSSVVLLIASLAFAIVQMRLYTLWVGG